MSLINEALRKARQAASERDSKEPEGPFRPAKAYPSRRSGGGGGPMAVALVAVAAAVVGASAAWWFLGDRQTASIELPISEVQSIEGGATSAPPEASPTPVENQSEVGLTQESVAQLTTPMVVHAADLSPAAQTDTQQTTTEPAPPAADAATPIAGPGGERIFEVEADLGYASLTLGFIVARSTNPFAEINGTEVRVGSEIDGFVVEAIEANRVVLRDDNGPLVLRVP